MKPETYYFLSYICLFGEHLFITTKFIGGDVIFLWTGTSLSYDMSITRDNKTDYPWYRVFDTQYTVKDALLYDSLSINVRVPGNSTDNIRNYTVSKVQRNVGDSVNISWTAPFFPKGGEYTIYHTDKVDRSIMQVTSSGVTLHQTKYEYHSRPYDSTNITFEIRDITLDDAGYYNGGTWLGAAWSGGGVVLIVHDKISKPQIQGHLNIMVGNFSELTCFTTSTSAPDYYTRLFPLSYTWFVNNTELTGETGETLRFLVLRGHKYNQYSCTAKDRQQVSDRSVLVRINPLCETLFDDSVIFQTNYAFLSGSDVGVTVAVPVIANPPPQGSDFTWSGPTGKLNIKSKMSSQNVIYKHMVISFIPIRDQYYFGNYTIKYKGRSITTVLIYEEVLDIPKPPMNFSGYSYAPGFLNLTWVSAFNGGTEQSFILSKNEGLAWEAVANISDPGEGRIVYYDPGTLVPGQTYWYRLKSCNRINCSLQSVDVCITAVKGFKQSCVNDRVCSAFFGLLAPFILSLLCNILCIIREIRRKYYHHRRKQNKEDEHSCPNTAQDQGQGYDDVNVNSAYQELGEVSKPSIYDKLK